MSRKRSGVIGVFGFLLGAVLIISGCGGGGGGSSSDSSTNQPVQPTTFSPTLGSWSGENISFTLKQGSLIVDELSVTFEGQNSDASGTCTYERTKETTGANIQVLDNKFTYEWPIPPGGTLPEVKISVEFTSATTAEIDVSWSISTLCGWAQGSVSDYAEHESVDSGDDGVLPSNAIKSAYMQYRNYPDPAKNRYAAWIEVTKDGGPAQSTDVIGFKITDSVGNAVTPTSSSFAQGHYYYYNCSTTPCTSPQAIMENGYAVNFSNIPAGKYRYEVEASDGQKFYKDIEYPGQLVLPIVPSTTMNSSLLANGDWVLNWINPTGAANWSEVDQLRIILMAGDAAYTELVYVRANSSVETVIIPASLISQAESLGKGPIEYWTIQTRAYDANNMNYARGYSH